MTAQIPPFRLEEYFAKWEFVAKYNLAASDAQTMTIPELIALADETDRAAWEALMLGYIPARGTPELLDAIAATYTNVTTENILCFAGAEEGMWCAFHALLSSGDHAIITVPNYQSFESIPLSICGVEGITGIPLWGDEPGWNFDLDKVRSAIRPNTRVIAVNFPNNPTGFVPDQQTFVDLIEICAERGIRLFSDEVYRGIERSPEDTLPQAADLSAAALSLNVMSKAYGLPGLRVGWIACCDKSLIARMEELKYYLSICNAAPSELLARIALRAAPAILKKNRDIAAANLALLEEFFTSNQLFYRWSAPKGGCVGYVEYRGADGAEEHCRRLVEEAGVLLAPASQFASQLVSTPANHFRIGFGRANMRDGLEAWRSFLSTAAPSS